MNTPLLLLQNVPEVRLSVPPAPGLSPLALLGAGLVVVLGAGVLAFLAWRRRQRWERDPSGCAFDRLAGLLHLTRREREAANQVAACVERSTALGVVLSASLFATGATRALSRGLPEAERRAIASLSKRLWGGSDEAG